MFNEEIEDNGGLTVNVTPAAGITVEIFLDNLVTGTTTKISNGSTFDTGTYNLRIHCTDGEKECEYKVRTIIADPGGTPRP
jgi:hypothetical protein